MHGVSMRSTQVRIRIDPVDAGRKAASVLSSYCPCGGNRLTTLLSATSNGRLLMSICYQALLHQIVHVKQSRTSPAAEMPNSTVMHQC